MKVSSLFALLAALMMSQAALADDAVSFDDTTPQVTNSAGEALDIQTFGGRGGGGGFGGGGFHGGGMGGGGFHPGGGGFGGGGFHPGGGGFGGGGFHPGGGGFGGHPGGGFGGHPGGGMGGGFHGPRPGPIGPRPAPGGGGFHPGPRPGPGGGFHGPRPGPVGPVHGPGHGPGMGHPGHGPGMGHGPGHGPIPNPGHPGWHGPSRGSRSPVRFHGGGYTWRHWSHAWHRPVYGWNWPLVRTVTCTAEDSVGYDYPVTETGYVGIGYRSRIEAIEDAALDRCYEETNGDEGCQLVGCTATY